MWTVNIVETINLCQLDWTFSDMFKQQLKPGKLERNQPNFLFLYTGAVPLAVNWTFFKQKGTNITDLESLGKLGKNHWFYLEGPKYVKSTYSRLIEGPTFEASTDHHWHSWPKPPIQLWSRCSWEPSHKATGRLDHSKRPNRWFTTPLSEDTVQLTTFHNPGQNLEKTTKEQPSGLWNVRKAHTNPCAVYKYPRICL